MPDFRALTLYVIRHGECQHNVEGWAASHDDSPLTEKGRQQARANGRLLREVAGRIDDLDFYASSLHRTCATMELIREELGLPFAGYRADRRLMEMDLGDDTRRAGSAVRMSQDRTSDEERWRTAHPGGESPAMVYERVGRLLAELTRDSVLVTHGVPLIVVRAHYLGLSGAQAIGYHMPHAGLLRLSMGTDAVFGR